MSPSWEPAIAQAMQQHGGRNRPRVQNPALRPSAAEAAATEPKQEVHTTLVVVEPEQGEGRSGESRG